MEGIKMNSRERILATIKHRGIDRVAVDLGSTSSSGISAIAYNNLKKYLAISSGSTRVYDVVQQVIQIEDDLVERFGVDVLDIGRAFNTDKSNWYEIALSDGSKVEYPNWFKPVEQSNGSFLAYLENGTLIGKMPRGATFFDQTVFPYQDGYPENYKELSKDMGKVIWSAFAHSPWDHIKDSNYWEQLRQKTLSLRNNTDKALMINCGCNLFEWGTFLRRIDNFLMDIYTDQHEVEKLLDALMEIHLKTLEKVCESVGDIVDVIRFGDDLGMDKGPFISPSIYQKVFKPRHKELCDYVKKHSQMHTFLHSCGSIYKMIPDLIEAGYDIINPVQTNCADMDPKKLKQEFGKDITFWGGGVDTRNILNRGTVNDVKEDVKRRLDIFTKGGGFVFNPIHNILPDVPPENIVAMFEAVKEFEMC
jgi:uroporphyrinogen decarboxylase